MIRNIGAQNSLFNRFMAEVRDVNIQKDSMRFRRNLERIGEIMAYEISKTFTYHLSDITTPLGIAKLPLTSQPPVVASILRAGLPMHQGFLNYFDTAENIFITAYRKYTSPDTFEISFEHISGPATHGKTVILIDPMLATGASMLLAYKAIIKKGTPAHVHIVSAIASKEGIDYLLNNLSGNQVTIWTGAIDIELTVKSFIVPGLGDAGDLAFGIKE